MTLKRIPQREGQELEPTRPSGVRFCYCIGCRLGRHGDQSCSAGWHEWLKGPGCYIGQRLDEPITRPGISA